jgi:hypothetical protein
VATAVGGFLGWAAIPLDVGVILVLGYLIGVATRAVFGAQADDGVQLSPFLTDVVGLLYLAAASAVAGAITGAIVGVAQHLSLPRRLRASSHWVRASIAGGAVAIAITGASLYYGSLSRTLEREAPGHAPLPSMPGVVGQWILSPNMIVVGVVFGVLYGTVTGVAVVRWVKRQTTEP